MSNLNDVIDALEELVFQQVSETGEDLSQTQINEIERQLNDLYDQDGNKFSIPRSRYSNSGNRGLEE